MNNPFPRPAVSVLGAVGCVPRPSRRMFLKSVLAGLAAGGSSAALLLFINHTLAIQEHPGAAVIVGFFGFCLLILVSGIFSELLVLRLMQDNLFELRLWLTRRMLSAPFQQLQSCGAPRLMSALTDDIKNIAGAYDALPVLIIEGSIALGGFVYVAYLSYELLLTLLLLLGVGLSGFFIAQHWSLRWIRLAREADDALFDHFRALTEGCKELKINERRRRAFLHELSVTADMIRTRLKKGLTIFILGAHSSKLLFFIAIGLVLFVLPAVQAIPADVTTGWTLSIFFVMAPISTIVNTVPIIGKGLISVRKIEALGLSLSEEALTEDQGASAPARQRPGVLELAGVGHSYHAEHEGTSFRLGPLDLRIEPGELIFIIGGNGNGKTTLAFLLTGLFVPETGIILLDGQPITDDQRGVFRQNFATVFADAFVFDSLLGYTDANSVARAESMLAKLQLDHKLTIRDGRFSTLGLSRGQRKRLALLTAYVEDRPFYLFDEWAAEQDPVFREIFYTKILADLKARGKTVIVITHDDRYYRLADRVLRLDEGRIEEIPVRRAPRFEVTAC